MDKIILSLIDLFQWICTTSIMAFVLVGLILLVKGIMKERLKAKWQYVIWFVLLFRLILPWTPETSFSLFNLFSLVDEQKAPIQEIAQDDRAQLQLTFTDNEKNPLSSVTSLHISTWVYIGALVIWILGVVLFTIYLFRMNRKFSKKLKHTSKIMDDMILTLFEHCKEKMGVKSSISLLATTEVESPTLYGFFRPKLLIPLNGLQEFDHNELRYIFLHELAHYKRKDILVNWIMTVLLIFHWFNPILWYAYHRMREDQELSCDEMAISHIHSDEVKNYGYTLIKLLQINSVKSILPTVANFSANKAQLKKRIIMITSFQRKSITWSIIGLFSILLIAFVTLTNAKAAEIKPYVNKQIQDLVNGDRSACEFGQQ
ncbi:M56 family metallopeptidase [Shimazuella sp. AN120528]|uniref:M56 family metallopeptidase n=1 Tax=Shimazuella soli TaxID=1892854 RepID=UPI001F0DCA0F|nr:M56 family metallopeptidase [Shimazuella soli]MCH5584063.1 M56 family metallopeptidase [Shimazuella soli]